ncbi:MAG: VanW family protein [Lachnospiraceae bacterium]|nr:VanW family protein [Lachnospiraceae bacterium]
MKKSKILTIVICSIAGVLSCLCLLYCLLCKGLEDTKIWKAVTVNGVSIQNMTKDEANATLEKSFQEKYTDTQIPIKLGDQTYSVNVYPMLGFDAVKVVDDAYQLGHGIWYQRGFDWLKKQMGRVKEEQSTIFPYVKYPEKAAEVIAASGVQSYNSLVQSSWEVSGNTLVIHKGQEGTMADTEQLTQLILTALEQHNYTDAIECPVTTTAIDSLDFQGIYDSIHKDAVSAVYDKKTDSISTSSEGISFDMAQAGQIYDSTAYGADAVINLDITPPAVTTDQLSQKLFEKVIASYTTTTDDGSSGRNNNIGLAAKACNGVILLPGETFSYNNTLGDTTAEKGYQMAGAYSSGEVVQELGGGICQVSSTIYAAVLNTNLEVVKRYNHSMTVGYLPLGMDATVSIGGPDFQFRNNRSYPVKLSVTYSGGTLAVHIIGSDENDYSVQVSVEDLGSSTDTTGEGEDAQTVTYTRVRTYRKFYDSNGNLVSTEDMGKSSYKNH